MKSVKAMLALLAVSSMIVVSACGSSTNESSDTKPDAGSDKAASTAASAGPLSKYTSPIEVTTVRTADASVKFAGSDTLENNEWTRAYKDELGINLKFKWIATSGDDATQKMNVMIASGDLPDIIPVNANQLKQLVDADMVEDLSSVYEKYATPLAKQFMDGAQLDSAKFDGKLMAIPNTNSSIDGANVLWVRTDWLKKLKLPEPKTMNDVYTIAEAFAKQDPDGNGKSDTFGLGINKGIVGGGIMGLGGFFNGFHAYPGAWIKDSSGSLVYGSILPETKAALLKLQEMYKAGLLDKEFGVKDGNKTGEDAVAGKIGLYYGAMWNPINPLQKGKDLDPQMEWEAYKIVSVDSDPARPQVGNPVFAYYAVKKGAKNPEAVMQMVNLFIEKGWGEKADFSHFFSSPDGIELFKHAPFNAWSPTKNLDVHLSVIESLKTGDTSKLNGEQLTTYEKIKQFNNGDNKQWNQARVFGESSSFAVINQYQKENLPLMNEFFGAPTESMGDKKATLDKMELETFTKVIMGEPISAFDKFVEDWKKLGGTDMTNEVNDWAKSVK
ncbi:extracellular solute-binding protein [Paenibacillus sp. VMFN-D1]|uniref:extracellular solute-binding protein n=1 Tax=Paenibacillus sp. VMFN-D1 TaxID=2135608 RepID=UPI000E2247DF|nr:extracellular solute-binding protein [Paenibacillus sp. VMFN-D1]RED39975.1 putative aldouronate transport system substrate-binding protein [Paenibacillus sp. VMFN-D1]